MAIILQCCILLSLLNSHYFTAIVFFFKWSFSGCHWHLLGCSDISIGCVRNANQSHVHVYGSLVAERGSHAELFNDRVEAITQCVRLQSADASLWGQKGGESECVHTKPRVPCECQSSNWTPNSGRWEREKRMKLDDWLADCFNPEGGNYHISFISNSPEFEYQPANDVIELFLNQWCVYSWTTCMPAFCFMKIASCLGWSW